MEKIIVNLEEKQRIDKYLSETLKESRSKIEKMLDKECITCNGNIAKSSLKIKNGDVIEFVKEYREEKILDKLISLFEKEQNFYLEKCKHFM